MEKNSYRLISKFKCCGKTMVTVIIDNKAACVMTELEYDRIIGTVREAKKNVRLKRSA